MPCGDLGADFLLIVGLCATVGGLAMFMVSDKLKKRKMDDRFPRKSNWYRKEGYQ